MSGLSPLFGRALRVSLSALLAASTIVAAVAPSGVAATAQGTVGPFTFTLGSYDLEVLSPGQLPYVGSTLVSSCGLTDEHGVVKYRAADGRVYDHPVNQAQCALVMLRNYRIDPDPAYLAQSVANADRLLVRTVWHAGARFFPYPFDFVNAWRSTMRAPWYSAMAQGQALSAFVRLHEVTGDPKWSAAAATTFASFKIARGSGTPWVTGIVSGRLWLDEYPSVPLDRTWNGHNFAAYGLYDYWRTTGSAEARLLLLGALHSSYVEASTRVRVPGGISQYCVSDACMTHDVRNPNYHRTHIGQLSKLHDVTGHWHFASLAEAFQSDSPRPSSGTVRLAAGVHRGYRFDAWGTGTLVTTVTLPASTTTTYSHREVPGALRNPGIGIGVWLRVSGGPLDGLFVRESGQAWPVGFVDQLTFIQPRRVQVSDGTYIGDTVAPDGTVSSSLSITTGTTTWTYDAYARVNGAASVHLTSGPLADRWLRLDNRMLRDTTLFTDVDASPFRTDIIWLDDQDITRGCAPYRYCPNGSVTREQMASFLVRALDLPPATRDAFADDDGRAAEGDINRLAASGIAAGCGRDRFCPTRPISRAEMASFLVRALDLPSGAHDVFSDDDGSVHEHDIDRLAASGITRGCSTDRFCPTAPVTRGQMAAFLRRALAIGTAGTVGSSSQAPDGAPTPSPLPTPSPTPAASDAPTTTPIPTPSVAPTATPTPSVGPTDTPSPTPEPTVTAPPPTATPEPSEPAASTAPSAAP